MKCRLDHPGLGSCGVLGTGSTDEEIKKDYDYDECGDGDDDGHDAGG